MADAGPDGRAESAVEIVVESTRGSVRGKNRVRAIVLALAEGTKTIPVLAVECAISESRIHTIARAAVGKGLLDKIPGKWPNMYRPGPNLLRRVLNPSAGHATATLKSPLIPHEAFSPEIGNPKTFTLRAHGLQASLPVLGLENADLGGWTSWQTKTGPMWKVAANGLRMQLRGRTLLVVSIPKLSVETSLDTLDAAVKRILDYVSEYFVLARKVARERYRIVAGSPARWYREPEFAIERYPGVPEGVRYRVSFWVDSSMGSAEVESTKLETIAALMSVGNEVSRRVSMATFE